MATQVGSIYYDVELNTATAIKQQRELDSGFNQLKKSGDGFNATLKQMSTLAAAVVGALATNKIIEYADAWTTVNNKLANATKAGETQAQVTERVFQVAQKSRASLESTAALYQRLELSTRKYVTSGYDAGRITETITKAFAVGGATGAEMSAAVTQLGQALASGVLRGEEFNSINEQAPILMQAFADQLGVTRDKMRGLAEQGKITADVIIKAIQAIEQPVDDSFSKLTATFAQNVTEATNNLTKFIGSNTTVQSVVSATGKAFVTATENLDALLVSVGAVAVAMAGKGVGAVISYTQAQMAQIAATAAKRAQDVAAAQSALVAATADQKAAQAAVARTQATIALYGASSTTAATLAAQQATLATATNAVATAQARVNVVAGAGAGIMRALGAAFTFLTGPAGLIMLAVGAFIAYKAATGDSKKPTQELTEEVKKLADGYRDLTRAQAEAGAAKARQAEQQLTEKIAEQKNEVKKLAEARDLANKKLAEAKAYGGGGYQTMIAAATKKQQEAADALAIANGELEKSEKQLASTQADRLKLQSSASGVQEKPKFDASAFKAKYDAEYKARQEILENEKRQIDEVNANTLAGEKDKADAIIAIRKSTQDALKKLDKKSQTSADKFDYESYYLGLGEASKTAWEKVADNEKKQLIELDKLRADGSIKSEKQYTDARNKITQSAELERVAIIKEMDAELEKMEAERLADYADQEEKKKQIVLDTQAQIAAARASAAQTKASTSGGGEVPLQEQLAKLDAEAAAKIEKKRQELQGIADLEAEFNAYKDAIDAELRAKRAAAEKKAADDTKKRNQEVVSSYSQLAGGLGDAFGAIASAMEASGDKQSSAYKAMFALSKAFAIAQAGLNLSLAISNAMANVPYPANLVAMAQVAASGAALVNTISSAAFGGGRRYGGSTSAGTVYQVNEDGSPEMWTASNGKQYMLGGTSGTVTSADNVGGGVSIVINNNASGVDVSATASSDGKIIEIAVNQALAAVASGISSKTGAVARAMQSATNTQWKTS